MQKIIRQIAAELRVQEQQVRGWSDMPVWVPLTPETMAFMQVSVSKAVAQGLTYRPLDVTARETLAWHRTRPAAQQETLRVGIKPDREKEVLAAWHAAHG